MAVMNIINKKDAILDRAQILIQTRGYNGFSYADIAAVVGIRKASIHHYFPTKEDLAVAVIEQYRQAFNLRLLNINNEKTWTQKISLYAKLYKQVLSDNKLCLCGMLASDIETLPEKAQNAVRQFFSDNVAWLSETLKTIDASLSKDRLFNLSWQIISTLQGAVIMSKALNNSEIFAASYEEMIQQLKSIK